MYIKYKTKGFLYLYIPSVPRKITSSVGGMRFYTILFCVLGGEINGEGIKYS